MYVDQVQKLYESTKREQNKQQLKLFNNQVAIKHFATEWVGN